MDMSCVEGAGLLRVSMPDSTTVDKRVITGSEPWEFVFPLSLHQIMLTSPCAKFSCRVRLVGSSSLHKVGIFSSQPDRLSLALACGNVLQSSKQNNTLFMKLAPYRASTNQRPSLDGKALS
jgi:hypothetical protein